MTTTPASNDILQRFIFDDIPVRGEMVVLNASWQTILQRRTYPSVLQHHLGEMVAAATLLAATVKMQGRLVLQIKATGPVSLMMVECTSQHTVRALAQWQGELPEHAPLSEITGTGHLAITIELANAKQPFQGVVSVEGDSIATALETYFDQSEQLATKIWLAANEQTAAGLLLQQLPEETGQTRDEEHWHRLTALASTTTSAELLSLTSETLLHRLFHEENCRLLSETPMTFSCSCSRQRVAETIQLLGEEDAHQLLHEKGHIEITCDFCNEHYHFDPVDVTAIFATTPSKSTKVH